MSIWFAPIVAKAYQYKAKLDPFRSGWIWDCKEGLLFASKLCKCDFMGYPAPLLPTDESRLHPSRNLATYYPTNASEIGLGSHEGFALQRLDLPMALSWLPINLAHEERELLDHCKYATSISYSLTKLILVVICTATSTLAIFEPDKHEILSLLVRLILSDSSPSSMAVLQSALALSSFHRHGLQADVFRFRARALRTLITSCRPGIEVPTVVQHIAASMILCHLEVCSSLGLHLCA